MSFERWIIDMVPHWVINEGWLPHLALFAGLIAFQIVPILLVGLCRLLVNFAQLVFIALLAIVPAAGIGVARALPVALSGTTRFALFLWFIASEAARGDTGQRGDSDAGPADAPAPSDIADACALLGLPEGGFTPDDLKRAYHRAIKRAHPDNGGNAADTMAILRARDRISEHFGWS